jgi:hypothetical protein
MRFIRSPVRLGRLSPSLVIACAALVIATAGTAIAATPAVKRALYAENAGKLGGRKLAQVAALPGPASSAARLVSVETTSATLAPQEEREVTIRCTGRDRVLSGGWTSTTPLLGTNGRPSAIGTWTVNLVNLVSSEAAVTLYATCIR